MMNCGPFTVAANIAMSSVILFQVVPTILGYHAWVSMLNGPATLMCPALCPSLGLGAFGRRVSVRMRRPFGRRLASDDTVFVTFGFQLILSPILYIYIIILYDIIYVCVCVS